MSRYTTRLCDLINANFDLGLQDYPLLHPEHRTELNQLIKDSYYTREIGFETAHLFKIKLNLKMKQIMPKYNQMYASQEIDYDPSYNVKMTETFTHDIDNSNTLTGARNTNDNSFTSDLPNKLNTYEDMLVNGAYADSSQAGHTSTTDTQDNVGNTKETYTKTQNGRSAGFTIGMEVKQLRDNIINVDMMIVEELNELFVSQYNCHY